MFGTSNNKKDNSHHGDRRNETLVAVSALQSQPDSVAGAVPVPRPAAIGLRIAVSIDVSLSGPPEQQPQPGGVDAGGRPSPDAVSNQSQQRAFQRHRKTHFRAQRVSHTAGIESNWFESNRIESNKIRPNRTESACLKKRILSCMRDGIGFCTLHNNRKS